MSVYRLLISIIVLYTCCFQAQAVLVLMPETEFTLRDEFPFDGIPEQIDTGSSGFTGFVTNDLLTDETFIEFAVGDSLIEQANFSIGMALFQGNNKTFDISTYSDGTGVASFDRFGQGMYLATETLDLFFTLFTFNFDVTDLYNAAVTNNDDYLGFRLHNVMALDAGAVQMFYQSSSLTVNPIDEPAPIYLLAFSLFLFVRRR